MTVQIISGSVNVLAGIALMALPMDNGAWTTTSANSEATKKNMGLSNTKSMWY